VLNTTEGQQAIRDSYSLRRAALVHKVPYYTTVAGARAVVQAIITLAEREPSLISLQSCFKLSNGAPFAGTIGASGSSITVETAESASSRAGALSLSSSGARHDERHFRAHAAQAR
jgi:hypothetical protein